MQELLTKTERFVKRNHEYLQARIAANKAAFGRPIWVCDFHSHSTYSDGAGDVAAMSAWAADAGLDLLAITDHSQLSQKADCEALDNLWCGQEYKCGEHKHHYVALGHNHEVLSDEASPQENLQKVRDQGGVVILAHPTGWLGKIYPEEAYADLELLAASGCMEIGNGAGNLINYFDSTDRQALRLWDRMLIQGYRMIGFGNSDSHVPYALGIVFNGIGQEPSLPVLAAGGHFVSNGPFLDLTVNGVGMGGRVSAEGCEVEITLRAVDREEIVSMCLIRDGQPRWLTGMGSSPVQQVTLRDTVRPGQTSYYRAECYAVDGHRAYTNPVWVTG